MKHRDAQTALTYLKGWNGADPDGPEILRAYLSRGPASKIPAMIAIRTSSDRLLACILVMTLAR